MSYDGIPFESEIAELTIAARRATAMLEKPGREDEAAGSYRRAREAALKDCFNPQTRISDPALSRSVSGEKRGKLFRLVAGLLEAHLDLYEAATERSCGRNAGTLADGIRLPALGVIKAGYLFMATCENSELRARIPEVGAILRKGEANQARRDMYVCQAMDLLKTALDMLPPAAAPERKAMPGRKTRVR